MRRLILPVLILLALIPGARAQTTAQPVSVAVDDFSFTDTSAEPADQTAAHEKRLKAFMVALRRDIAADGRYQPVPAMQADARFKIIGGVQKTSTLVQWAKAVVIDATAKKIVLERLYTFRGDTDEAWDHAEAFVSREIRAALDKALAPAPIALAVFDFELEDTTAAPSSGLAASDAAYLAEATAGVRDLLAQSGRYRMIDVGGVGAEAAKARKLRDCGGCEAAIARELGADQSLIGVVRRVSRTEYTMGFQVRDAKTGAVVSRGDSGLRMGADYSWKRGAVRLVGDQLVEAQR
ncbi:DUF3280 domain-containing protein [Bradyrhizobium liaoningense]|uniref:DUF3280 domain-containing protein n=1 Tax=Bradyrhizobium liaoningense TaxID=43992 RepID=UPI001BA902F5|nr:DUF3280 domain-containing protein [Bradyrhizobium liaoningense]MBR0716072.1 DUF2380 domain-containing protein [Bradyrhizobium liaoningense]